MTYVLQVKPGTNVVISVHQSARPHIRFSNVRVISVFLNASVTMVSSKTRAENVLLAHVMFGKILAASISCLLTQSIFQAGIHFHITIATQSALSTPITFQSTITTS